MIFTSDYQIDIPNQDILSFLFERTRFKEDDPIWLDGFNPNLNVTLRQTRDLTHRIGRGLRDLGIGAQRGGEDIVLSFVENQVMVAPTLLGVLCAAGIHATCPMTATAFELTRQLKLSSPKILVCSPQTQKVAQEAVSQSGIQNIRILTMMSESLDIVDANGKSIISNSHLQWRKITDKAELESTTACLVYSSGTTGVPKGVKITHYNIVANLLQMAYHFDHFATKAISEGEYLRMPGIMQNAVVLGITVQTMMAMQCGMQVYMFKKFDFPYLIECIRKYRLSTFFMVPAIWNRISNECTKEDLAHFRFVMSGASPLPQELQAKVQKMLPEGVIMRVNWGMTETTTGAAQPAPMETGTEGSSGRLLPNMQAIIIDAEGKRLGPGQPGELCCKGPNMIREYYKNPEATKSAFTQDGWFRSGDIGYFSEDGKLYIVGRSKELLKYKSHQISPTEIEAILGQCPGVADIGVIGVPDGNGNDLPRAYVVASKPSLSEKDIHEFLNAKVSNYKRLRGGVRFVEEIPRNVNAKVMRNVLKEWVDNETKKSPPKAKL